MAFNLIEHIMKPLATNNILNVLLFPGLLLLILTLMTIGGAATTLMPVPFLTLIFIGLFLWIIFGVRETCNVFYDDNFIYLQGLLKHDKVPISKLMKVARDQSGMKASGISAWRYRLEFEPGTKISSQIIYEVAGGTRVAEFIAFMKRINAALVVE